MQLEELSCCKRRAHACAAAAAAAELSTPQSRAQVFAAFRRSRAKSPDRSGRSADGNKLNCRFIALHRKRAAPKCRQGFRSLVRADGIYLLPFTWSLAVSATQEQAIVVPLTIVFISAFFARVLRDTSNGCARVIRPQRQSVARYERPLSGFGLGRGRSFGRGQTRPFSGEPSDK